MTEKTKKPTGMIRKGAVVPFAIIATLIVVFNYLFLDSTIRKTLEFVGGKANGAEVNIESVTTSFKNLSLVVKKIEVTDTTVPTHNLFEIGEIRFKLLWDAILRAKLVVDESTVSDIKVKTERKSAGEVYPVEKSKVVEVATDTAGNAKEEFKGNVFGDISALMAGDSSKDVLKNAQNDLESLKFYSKVEAEIEQRQKELDEQFKNLPSSAEFDSYQKRLDSIDWSKLSDIKSAPKILKEADQLKDDISSSLKKYNEAKKKVEESIRYASDVKKQANQLVDSDIKKLESKMSLPDLDSENIARVLFGPEFSDKLQKYRRYFDMAKEYMPPKKDVTEVVAAKNPRGEGRNYQFGKVNGYPLFWLKLASISSDNEQGRAMGKLENLTTDQSMIAKPTKFDLAADFKQENIQGVKVNAIFDHRTIVNDSIKLSVASFPVAAYPLSQSDDVKFSMKSAVASTVIETKLVRERLSLEMNNVFNNVDYEVQANNKHVNDLLGRVAADAKRVTLDARAEGSVDKLSFRFKTNLADLIKNALAKVLQEKINAAKDKARKLIDEKLGGQKQKVDSQLASFKDKYGNKIEEQKSKLDSLTAKVDEKKNSKQDALKSKGKDALKSLKKKFKF